MSVKTSDTVRELYSCGKPVPNCWCCNAPHAVRVLGTSIIVYLCFVALPIRRIESPYSGLIFIILTIVTSPCVAVSRAVSVTNAMIVDDDQSTTYVRGDATPVWSVHYG